VASGKKFGGVKQTRRGKSPAVSAADTAPRRIGGVKASARGNYLQSCPQNCPGEYIGGMWIHSQDCPWVAVIWKAHGATEKQWRCMYDCNPVELPSGWTHPFDCPFWTRTDQTPFDELPPHDKPIQSAMESGLLGADTVSKQKERIRRGESQEIDPYEIFRKTFEEFPEALRDDDDDLPF
jgi:hypothetical protein